MPKKRHIAIFLILAILVITGSIVLFDKVIYANNLALQSLHLNDLPEHSQLRHEGYVDINSISHPLGLEETANGQLETPPKERQHLYEYQAAYDFSALVHPPAVFVANNLYRYTNPSQAERAARTLSDEIKEEAEVMSIETLQSSHKDSYAKVFAVTGDEGDSVYWLIGAQDDILYLLMANGMEESKVSQVFEQAMWQFLKRQN
jgi:hypothetical protein